MLLAPTGKAGLADLGKLFEKEGWLAGLAK